MFRKNEQTDFIERTGQIEQTGSRKQIGSTSTEEKGSTKQFRSNISDEIIPPTVPTHTSEQSEENFTLAPIGEMFKKPTFGQLEQFFSFHPKIPTEKVPFDVKQAYNRTTTTGATLPRHWLTFDNDTRKLHCSLRLAYLQSSASVFTSGLSDFKHVYQRIQEHECSKIHSASVEAFLIRKSSRNIVHMVDNSALDIRKREVQQRRAVVQRLVRIIMYLRKQGLAFRGHRHEAAHALKDNDVNHGNFLELVKLVAESDDRLKRGKSPF